MFASFNRITGRYACLQAAYWFLGCLVISFSAVYLKGCGFTNGQTGLICASGDVLGFFLVAALSAYLDRGASRSPHGVLRGLGWILAASLLGLLLFSRRLPGIAFFYLFCIALVSTLGPINTTLYAFLSFRGEAIDFGLSRGIGSLAYALTSLLFGHITGVLGSGSLPFFALFGVFLYEGALLLLRSSGSLVPAPAEAKSAAAPKTSLGSFFSRNHCFLWIFPGIALLFAANNTCFTYLIHIVSSRGGNAGTVGRLLFLSALSEIPVMFFYSRLRRRFSAETLLRFSLLVFCLRILCLALSKGLSPLYFAFSLQSLSFGLYTPAMVDFIRQTADARDSARGQSLALGIVSLGQVFAKPAIGMLYDRFPVNVVLLVQTSCLFIGALLCFRGIRAARRAAGASPACE